MCQVAGELRRVGGINVSWALRQLGRPHGRVGVGAEVRRQRLAVDNSRIVACRAGRRAGLAADVGCTAAATGLQRGTRSTVHRTAAAIWNGPTILSLGT